MRKRLNLFWSASRNRVRKPALSCYISRAPMPDSKSPLDKLDRQEILWLAGILKDACRERLEKNLVSQEFEERLYQRGPVEGRMDPRPFLKIWEPRYRKFLAVATELQAWIEAEEARKVAESLRAQFRRPAGSARTKTRGAGDAAALQTSGMDARDRRLRPP